MYKRLRDMREDKDLKQRELAEILNVSQTTYSRYESGELDIPSAALIKLADFYNVSVVCILSKIPNTLIFLHHSSTLPRI